MFTSITLHGGPGATLVWGWHTVAELASWQIRSGPGGVWTLTATLKRADRFMCRRTPILFTAPREHKGFWAWPLDTLDMGQSQLVAKLGPPEQ